ncbi:hypothetical protein OJ997_16880 [Solirubrobacter phytolaccae]|uniref:Uncharacterized protein n=1 Tax=Solirubrobacter phytolaccae TaxID=1404360 RepID=A0A9X3N9M1_9ACTN|nr:hypothetical protein [Solirubrobacter phytolaccae]MDA0181981.1 hypothetical protein [Solirubrobacter phytolaccae]
MKARIAQFEQQAEQAFFVRLCLCWGLMELLDRPGRDDHNRLRSPHGARKYDDWKGALPPLQGINIHTEA